MTKTPAYSHEVTAEQLSAIMERYSDSGYTNIHEEDIIIDLTYLDGDEYRQELATLLGISVDDLPDDGLLTIH